MPVVLIEALTNTRTRDEIQAQVFNQLESVADIKRDQITSWISDSSMALGFLLSDPSQRSAHHVHMTPQPSEAAQAQIDGILSQAIATSAEQAPRFRSLFLYLPDGRVVAASDTELLGRILLRQPYF